jgi:cytochrome b6-f complex iron-sulfur subunit
VADRDVEGTRRSFIGRLWLVLGGVALAEAAWIAVSFFRPRRRSSLEGGDTIYVAGPVDQFEPGSVTPFPDGRFYLARLEDGGFLALNRECTHLGCTVPWIAAEKRFVCPCHASSFDIRGDVLGPPAPRPLDVFPVRIENHIVKVDLRRPRKRTVADDAQVTLS